MKRSYLSTAIATLLLSTFAASAGLTLTAPAEQPPSKTEPRREQRTQPRSNHVDLRFYGFGESFEWKETMDGQRLLKESGPIFGVGGDIAAPLSDPFWIEARGEFFLGDVDYDGHIQHEDGRLTPHKSTTSYTGFKLEGDLAIHVPINRQLYARPFFGLGFRGWNRTLGGKLSSNAIEEGGYEERWLLAYAIIGISGGIALNEKTTLFIRTETRLPLNNSETVDLSNAGGPDDVEIEPGKEASLYAEAGIIASRLTASLFVETLHFSESDPDENYRAFLQPESDSTMFGLKVGLAF
ncbi:MAG: hypothetical protein M9935_11445 [Kiritimatiellae bacterium]|nr:hypothetical protein [Kiritimatiellia bacterium]